MLGFVLILAASSIGVYSQRCAAPTFQPRLEQCYPYTNTRDLYEAPTYQYCPGTNNPIIITVDSYQSPPILPCDGYYLPQTPSPVPTAVQTIMPVMPFINDLPNCPDICFNEILMSPLGCLDPILTIYSAQDVCPLPNLPVSPLSPATSLLSTLAPPLSKLLPPVCKCDCYGGYLNRGPIPPPFI